MDHEVTASYVWTADELIRARENHSRAQCRPVYRAGIKFLSLMAILAGWCSYRTDGWSFFTVLAPLGGLYLLLLRKYDVRWSLRRHFKKRPDRNSNVVWVLREDELQTKTEESESRTKWNQIAKIRRSSAGFLLYANDTMFHWLPMTAFASDEDRKRADELLRCKVKDFADVK